MLKMESSNINNKINISSDNNQVDYLIKSFQNKYSHPIDSQQQQQQHNYKINNNPMTSKQFIIDEHDEDLESFSNNKNIKNSNKSFNNNNNNNNNISKSNIINYSSSEDFDSSDNEDADKILLNIQQSPLLSNTNLNQNNTINNSNHIPPYVNNHKRKSINMESLSLTSPQQNSFKPNISENEISQHSLLNSPLPQLNRISNNLISIVNSISNKKNNDDHPNNNNNHYNINQTNPYDPNNSSPLSHDDLSDDDDTNEFENNNNHLSSLSLNSPQLSISQNGNIGQNHHSQHFNQLHHDNQNVPNNCNYPKCCICLYGPPPSFYTSAPTWADICYIALYCLTISKPELKYYHIKKDICSFIDCHYETICMRKRTSIWRQTVNMTLSHPQYFEMFQQESALENGRKGYYGLKQIHDPYEHTALNKRSRRKRRHEQKMIQEELKKNGFTNLLLNSPNNSSMTPQYYANNSSQAPHGFYLSQHHAPNHHHNQQPHMQQIPPHLHPQNHLHQQHIHHIHNPHQAPLTPNHSHHLHSQSPSPMATPQLQYQQTTPQMTSNHHQLLTSPYLKNNMNMFSPPSTPNHLHSNNINNNNINNNSSNNNRNNLQQQFNDEIDHHQNIYNQKKLKQSSSAPSIILPKATQTPVQIPQFVRAKSFDDMLNYYYDSESAPIKTTNQKSNLRNSVHSLNYKNDDHQFNKQLNPLRSNTLQRLEFEDEEEEREVPSSSRLTSNRLILSHSSNNINQSNNLKISSNNIFGNNNNNNSSSTNSRSNSPQPLSSPNQDEYSSENESLSSSTHYKSKRSSLSSSTINTMSLMNINSSNSNITISNSNDSGLDEMEDDNIYYGDDEADDEDQDNSEGGSPKKRIRKLSKSNETSLLESYYEKHINSNSSFSTSKEELENLSTYLMWSPNKVQKWLENRRNKEKSDRVISFSATSTNCSSTPNSNNNSPTLNQSSLVPSNDINNNYKSSVNSLLN